MSSRYTISIISKDVNGEVSTQSINTYRLSWCAAYMQYLREKNGFVKATLIDNTTGKILEVVYSLLNEPQESNSDEATIIQLPTVNGGLAILDNCCETIAILLQESGHPIEDGIEVVTQLIRKHLSHGHADTDTDEG